jgi:hypothetical protein
MPVETKSNKFPSRMIGGIDVRLLWQGIAKRMTSTKKFLAVVIFLFYFLAI